MSILKNKRIFQKLGIVLLLIIFFNFVGTNFVFADDGSWGGKLLVPVMDLVTTIGDGILGIVHKAVIQQDEIYITVDMTTKWWEYLSTALVFIAAAIAAAALIVATAGLAAAALAAAGITVTAIGAGTVVAVAVTGGVVAAAYYNSNVLPADLKLPLYNISPEEMFKGEIPALDVDFINPKAETKNSEGDILKSTSGELRATIASWYIALRTISLVALLSILAYIGIRMLMTTVASDKAKYKGMMVDWVVAICLVFFMHYIMSFALVFNNKFIEVVSLFNSNNMYINYIQDDDGKIWETLEKLKYKSEDVHTSQTGDDVIVWGTDLMGKSRIDLQMNREGSFQFVGYVVVYLVLVLFTCIFLFTYVKRVVYMAFLTVIAPMVAMTYPLDKLNDGKAQAFDMWFKEYIFNLLIQPMHLIIYTVLVTSAFKMASTNIIYSLVALGFMMPAEKIIRKFFGFEKAGTPGMLGGAAGAAFAMSGLQKVMGLARKGPNGGKPADSSKQEEANALRIRRSGFNPMSGIAGNSDQQSSPRAIGTNDKDNSDAGTSNDRMKGLNLEEDRNHLNGLPDQNANTGIDVGDSGNPEGADIDGRSNSDLMESLDANNTMAGMTDGYEKSMYEKQAAEDQKALNDRLVDMDDQYGPGFYDDGDLRTNKDIMASAENNKWKADNSATEGEKLYYNNLEQSDRDTLRQRLMKQDQMRMDEMGKTKTNNAQQIRDQRARLGEEQRQRMLQQQQAQQEKLAKENKRKSAIGRFARATAGGTTAAFKSFAKENAKKVGNVNPTRFIGKTVAGAAGAATFGALAAAAGIASGDVGTFAKYTSGGLVGGSGFGEGLYNTLEAKGPNSNMNEKFREAYYGDDYKNQQIKEYTDRFTKDDKHLKYLKETFGDDKKAKQIMKEVAPRCINNGITDIQDIATIQKMVDENPSDMNVDKAMSAAKYAKRIGKDPSTLKQNDQDQYIMKWQKEFTEAGYKDENLGKKTFDYVTQFYDTQDGLNKI